jgi:glycosyltransferase involved in cell wall biosynthesis
MTSLSIITTVYNDENNITDCLNSVKNQNIKNFEHIIVDAGSTDSTIQILKKIKKKDDYLKIYIKKNINIYEGINFGIKKAKGNLIGLLHSDDFYKTNNTLKTILKEFKKNPLLLSVHSNVSIVSRNKRKKEVRYFKSKQLNSTDFIKGIHPPHTSLFIKKKVFKDFGMYNEKLKIASDFEFMLRVFGINKVRSKYINKTLVVMRTGGTSTKNLLNIVKSNCEVYKAYTINKLNINIFLILRKVAIKLFQIKFY